MPRKKNFTIDDEVRWLKVRDLTHVLLGYDFPRGDTLCGKNILSYVVLTKRLACEIEVKKCRKCMNLLRGKRKDAKIS